MKRTELLKNPIYWTTSIQMELYRLIEDFMKEKNMNKSQLAEYLGCSKGYVTQLLSGDYDHKLSKFVELALKIDKVPQISFIDVDEFIESERKFKYIAYTNELQKMNTKSSGSRNEFKIITAA